MFPVVAVADRKHALQGKLSVERRRGRWWSIKTAWFARPRYGDPFLIRGDRLDGPGVVRFGVGPSAPMIAVRGGTLNGNNGFRSVPGATYVKRGGCYSWQVDGRGFSYRIVFKAVT